MTDHILAIDQGTTNTKALIIAPDGEIVASAAVSVGLSYPKPGWAEADGVALWQSVEAAIAACREAAPDASIAAIGISNQRESVMLWDRETGVPIGPCVIWQCRRSVDRIAAISEPDHIAFIRSSTGLALDPLFPAAKIGWLLDHIDGARQRAARGSLCAGTIDAWLIYKLTGGRIFATDASNASRTQLFDLETLRWSDRLGAIFDVPISILPEIRGSDAHFGLTYGCDSLPDGIPIQAALGDSHAALFGHGVRKPGVTKATFGTGSSLMTLTDRPVRSENGLSTTIAWWRGTKHAYALEGNITVSGHAASWMANMLGLQNVEALTDLAGTVEDADGVCFVPALAGMGAPHWDASARGVFSGLSLSTRPAHLARAALEAIALQVSDVSLAMERDLGIKIESLLADGGASVSAYLMQLQADILGRPVTPSRVQELSAVGAGAMAGLAIGLWTEADVLSQLTKPGQTFRPQIDVERRKAIYLGWSLALDRAKLH